MSGLFWSAMGVVTAAIAAPAVVYLIAPLLRGTSGPPAVPMGRAEDLPLGVPQRMEVAIRQLAGWVTEDRQVTAWVVRFPDQLYVFDPHCTHLGCAYHWEEQKKQFFCPCHAGVFDAHGKVISGPPPRPLDTYPYEIRDGLLYVVPRATQRMV
jgi:menaquinol-cytochrome c reductase iron-sulfur subunit